MNDRDLFQKSFKVVFQKTTDFDLKPDLQISFQMMELLGLCSSPNEYGQKVTQQFIYKKST
jgi:hypothetical protein